MAEALSVLLSFPPDGHETLSPKKYDEAMQSYLKKLDKISHSTWTKTVGKKNLLDMLNPEVNSIPYMISLLEQMKNAGTVKGAEPLLNYAVIFAATFDPVQVRYLGEHWRRIMEFLIEALPSFGSTDLSPVVTAKLRLDPTAGTFTSTHLRLVRQCLAIGTPSTALPILDKNIYALPATPPKHVPDDLLSEDHALSNVFITPDSKFSLVLQPEYILEYYLLGAHTYLSTHNYPRARLFLEYVLLHPSAHHAVSGLQVEAYRKWVFLGLLAQGHTYPLPRTHDASVMKSVRAIAKPYDSLAESFEKREWRKYMAELDVGTAMWHEDGNLRLVKEAGDALLRYRVMDLQKTYAALPIGTVSEHLGFTPEQTAQLVQEMIRARHLAASLTPAASGAAAESVLRFHDTMALAMVSQDADLEAQTRRIEALVSFVRDADRRLLLTKEYVEYAKRSKRTGPDADLADQMDLTWDNGGGGGGSMGGFGGMGGMGGAGGAGVIEGLEDEDGDEDLMGDFR